MGYCYDTALTLDQAAKKQLLDKLATASDELNELFGEACDCYAVDPKTKIVFYHWEYSKWDEEETEFITSFLNSLDDHQYSYVRLGESNGDLEQWGDLEDDPFDARVDSRLIFNQPAEQ